MKKGRSSLKPRALPAETLEQLHGGAFVRMGYRECTGCGYQTWDESLVSCPRCGSTSWVRRAATYRN